MIKKQNKNLLCKIQSRFVSPLTTRRRTRWAYSTSPDPQGETELREMHVRLDITGPDMYEDIMTIQSMYLLEPTPLITEAVVRAALGITSITPAWNLPSISKLPVKETFFHSTVIYLFVYLFIYPFIIYLFTYQVSLQ